MLYWIIHLLQKFIGGEINHSISSTVNCYHFYLFPFTLNNFPSKNNICHAWLYVSLRFFLWFPLPRLFLTNMIEWPFEWIKWKIATLHCSLKHHLIVFLQKYVVCSLFPLSREFPYINYIMSAPEIYIWICMDMYIHLIYWIYP